MKEQFYFLCVKGTHGGPEAIHQIVDRINRETDYAAHVVYFEKDFAPQEKFRDFKVDYLPLSAVPDTPESVLCVSETHTYFFRKFKNAKKVMIWLSLNYYLRNIQIEKYGYKERKEAFYHLSRLPGVLYPALYVRDKLFLKKKHFVFDMDGVRHTYNCRYVQEYLQAHGVAEDDMIFLDGPVRGEYFDLQPVEKRDIAAYNPGKGAEKYAGKVLDVLHQKYPDIQTVAIRNMRVGEVRDTLLSAKAYFDFGDFPGPEKLVKESALCRCNIITGTAGAAKNRYDIPIPDTCKFDMDTADCETVADTIYERIRDYDKYVGDYDPYRESIRQSHDDFSSVVKNFVAFAAETRT